MAELGDPRKEFWKILPLALMNGNNGEARLRRGRTPAAKQAMEVAMHSDKRGGKGDKVDLHPGPKLGRESA